MPKGQDKPELGTSVQIYTEVGPLAEMLDRAFGPESSESLMRALADPAVAGALTAAGLAVGTLVEHWDGLRAVFANVPTLIRALGGGEGPGAAA